MNVQGTLNHPSTRDPQLRHLPKQDLTMNDSPHRAFRRPEAGTPHSSQNRTRQMQLMPESLARAQLQSRLYEAESEQTALRVVRARRLQRRAERVSLRARRAVAMAVMQ
ncbi:hypothetical protein RM572_04560 [Streptomyces sp. DSM 42041]|uniref:Uncharacterized protein n=1 Tax=Streptomyces hazeniae TaxID=3075538 RepID=A0ABU2NR01_9ACTN|nr:hypothetical protein [Streptomyces sp. DSM 42041]MDT0378048.1 hypothetical protein [Streptomyces sp. DSM 42041]